MPLVTESVPTTEDLRPLLEPESQEAEAIKEHYLGGYECYHQKERHLATWNHARETGAIAMMAINYAFDGLWRGSASKRRQHRHLAGLTGIAHDDGKYTGDDIICVLDTPDDIGPVMRDWLVYAHCSRGGDMYRKKRLERNDMAYFFTGFVSENHHGHRLIQPLPSPDDYATYERRYALAWGYNHLINLCDKLQAIAFDPSRTAYREKREGRQWLSPEVAYRLVIGPNHQEPVLDDRTVPVRALFKELLGLPEDFDPER